MNRTALYRFFDADGVLLYVGITENVEQRWTTHASQKRWWPDVVKKPVEWFDTRAEAEAAERDAIRLETPLYNVVHTNKPRTRRVTEPQPGPAAPLRLRVLAEMEARQLDAGWLKANADVDLRTVEGWASRPLPAKTRDVIAVADALAIDRNEAAALSGQGHDEDWTEFGEGEIAARDASDMDLLMELSMRLLGLKTELEVAVEFMRHAGRPRIAAA